MHSLSDSPDNLQRKLLEGEKSEKGSIFSVRHVLIHDVAFSEKLLGELVIDCNHLVTQLTVKVSCC